MYTQLQSQANIEVLSGGLRPDGVARNLRNGSVGSWIRAGLVSWLIAVAGMLLFCGGLEAQAPTQIVLTTPTPNIKNHTAVALTATVTLQAGGAVPGGTVTFFDDGIYVLGTVTIQFGTSPKASEAVLNTSFAGGTHNVTASYNGLSTTTTATSFGPSLSPPLQLTVTGTELVAMNCVLYAGAWGSGGLGNPAVNPGGYDCFADGFSRQTLSGTFAPQSVTAGTTGTASSTYVGNYYVQLTGAFASPPVIPIDSFITADFANLGVAGILGLSKSAQMIWTQPLFPVDMAQATNGVIFGAYQPEPTGVSQGNNPTFPVGPAPVQVVTADVNGDGNLDIVVAHNDPTVSVGVLLGNGDGTFQSEATYSLLNGNGATNLAVGDVNGDGFPDIVVSNGSQLTVLTGSGTGSFVVGQSFPAGNGAAQVALTDLNGDGILDIAVMNVTDATIGILQGNGDGSFQPQTTNAAGTQPIAFAVADLNADGIPDITVAGTSGPAQGELTFLTGQGGLSYQQNYFGCDFTSSGVGTGQYTSIQATDMDGDGVPDLLFGYSFSGYTVAITNPLSPYPSALYVPGSCYPLNYNAGNSVANGNSTTTSSMAAADFTGNGMKDLLTIPAGAQNGYVGFGTSALGAGVLPVNFGGPPFGVPQTVDFILTPTAGTPYAIGVSPTTTIIDNAAPQATLSLPGPFLSLPAVEPGGTSSVPITITSTGYAPLLISGISFPTGSSVFSLGTNNCPMPPASLPPAPAPGNSCTFTIVFNPVYTPSTVWSGSISIADNDPYAPQGYALLGSLFPDPVSSPSPTSVNFGPQQVNTISTPAQSITVTNTGYGNMYFTGPIVSSSSAFQVAGGTCTATTILTPATPGNSCTILVVFAPTTTGVQTGGVTIPAYSYGGTTTIALTGTGTSGPPAPVVNLSPGSLNFGAQPVGGVSGNQMITVTNTGTAALTFGAAPLTSAAGFNLIDGCAGVTLAPPPAVASCTITVSFSPTAAVLYNPSITLTDNAGTQVIQLTGTGTAAPIATLTPSGLNFGSQAVNSTSGTQTITVTNTGTAALTFGAAPLTSAPGFNLIDGCAGVTLAPPPAVASCTITVSFSPTAAVLYNPSITLTDNAGTQVIQLTGTGTAAPIATLTPTSLNFGPQPVNSTSGTRTITVTNTGTAALTFGAAPLTSAAGFNLIDGCAGDTLAPPPAVASCSITVSFSPTAAILYNPSITLTDNAGTQVIQLTGTGTAAPIATLTPTSLNFGPQPVNSTSGTQTITVTNTGTAALTFGAAPLTSAAGFNLIDGCAGVTLAPPPAVASCTITVSFSPTAAVLYNPSITLTDNAGTQVIQLTGTGTAAPIATLTPTSLNFGTQPVNSTSGTQTITVTNTGTAALTFGAAPLTSAAGFNLIDGCAGVTLAPPPAVASCTITVSFSPTAAVLYNPSITLTDNAGTQVIQLSGTGTAAPIALLTPTSLNFGTQPVNSTSGTQTITVTNTGTAPLTFGAAPLTTASGFNLIDGCAGVTLAPPPAVASCTITVSFSPTAAVLYNPSITLTDNAGTQVIQLNGTGTAAPVVNLSSTSLNFGSLPVGNTSGTQTITVTNTGTANLIFGANPLSSATGFNISDGCAGITLAPNVGNCVITISFSPTAASLYNPSITLTDNAGTQLIQLTGTGITGTPIVTLTPGSLGFGAQATGTSSASQVITVTNSGTAPLTFGANPLTGAAGYNVNTTCGGLTLAPLPAVASCTITVIFSPATAGADNTSLTLTDNAGTQNIPLTGTAVNPAPVASVSPGSITASSGLGVSTGAGIITITNTGNAPLVFSATALGIMGAGAGSWKTTTTCQGATLSPGQACTVSVYFDPTTAGTQTATLTISDNATPSSQQVALNGTGVMGSYSINPTSLSFGSLNVGTVSAGQTLTIANTGTVPVFIGTPSLSGPSTGSFGFVNNTCTSALGVGMSCTFTVTFDASTTGSLAAVFNMSDYSPTSQQTVSLSGTGTGTTSTLSPSSLAFGNVSIGAQSANQGILVKNTGTGTLNVTNVTITGNSTSYITGNNCAAVAPGGTCNISVAFVPEANGSLPATVEVFENAPGSPQTVALNGTGIVGPVDETGSVTVSNSASVFNHATQLYTRTITVTNSGTVGLPSPWYVVLTNLAAGVTVTNATGTASGGPYLAGTGHLGTQTFTVTFKDPSAAQITFLPKVYSGPVQ